jgi:hypothetical protein
VAIFHLYSSIVKYRDNHEPKEDEQMNKMEKEALHLRLMHGLGETDTETTGIGMLQNN